MLFYKHTETTKYVENWPMAILWENSLDSESTIIFIRTQTYGEIFKSPLV